MISAKDRFFSNDKEINAIIVDTGPLIHLVGSGLIDDLLLVCDHLIIPDMVFIESTREDKAFSNEIKLLASNEKVKISPTETGRMYGVAIKADPSFKAKDAGERAILDWLLDELDNTDKYAIVLYENGKVPKLINNHNIDANVSVLTTRAFMEAMVEHDLTDKTWDDIVKKFETINSKIQESHFYSSKKEKIKQQGLDL